LFKSFVKKKIRFRNNEIDLEAFEILDETEMKHFFPKMGTLLKLKTEYQNYVEIKKN
jgi:hypothetical protein